MKKLIDTDVAQEMFDRIKRASKSVAGTKDFRKYDMQMEIKSISGVWKYFTWNIPIYDATKVIVTIETWKDKTYLIVEDCLNAYRYTLTDEVKNLISDLIKKER